MDHQKETNSTWNMVMTTWNTLHLRQVLIQEVHGKIR